MREDGAYFGKTRAGWFLEELPFFGFKLHALAHVSGAIIAAALTPGNYDDRPAAEALCAQTAGGVALGDAGYGGEEAFEAVGEGAGVLVVTPRDAG